MQQPKQPAARRAPLGNGWRRIASVMVLLLVAVGACRGKTTSQGPPAHRVEAADEPPGTNCPLGGVRLESGVDADRSGTLDPEEVESTRYVCAEPGTALRLGAATAEQCPEGGVVVESGVDEDADGSLVTMLLRPGNTHSARGAVGVLSRLIREIRARCPKTHILVRADSGFAVPRLIERLEQLARQVGHLDYVLGLARNSVL